MNSLKSTLRRDNQLIKWLFCKYAISCSSLEKPENRRADFRQDEISVVFIHVKDVSWCN